ncbi:CpsD/CapB family tyrosine-protein kinase [Pelotomaculum sp. PtaB.Bin117]|uniref:CpsD/CapB family tyrosine-protein kinase n=1 Tax=Pelotomaculum sp. PtaB.Bin117 TaxID=1811694 RepID=UPI0009CA8314|nr:CpsD/CapB family tyrosine-protein kinase [Pelotomaculum sp. PtaB.Bin117]OPX92330.1 MAG: Tyrosine-protein kinase YwqD [Pelotomaculum sp. PtaB.Bin117]
MPVSRNGDSALYAYFKPKSAIAEAFRTLRTNISFSSLNRPFKTIMTTSAGPLDGKSTVTSNMGVVMAQAGSRVLIVDCDLRKPVMHKNFETDNHRGLTNLLVQDLDIAEVIKPTRVEGLSLLTSGPIPPNPSELLGSLKMKNFLEKAAGMYDIVFIDSLPVIAVTDASVLAPLVDGVMLVVKSGATKIDMVKEAKNQLKKAKARIIGVVLNEVKMKSEDYHYYYYYKSRNKPSKEVVL